MAADLLALSASGGIERHSLVRVPAAGPVRNRGHTAVISVPVEIGGVPALEGAPWDPASSNQGSRDFDEPSPLLDAGEATCGRERADDTELADARSDVQHARARLRDQELGGTPGNPNRRPLCCAERARPR